MANAFSFAFATVSLRFIIHKLNAVTQMKRYFLTQIVCATTLIAAPLVAQEVDVRAGQTEVKVNSAASDVNVQRSGDQQPNIDRTRRNLGVVANAQIVDWLIVDQRNMIELSEFAIQKAETPQVRQLAEKIINDHQTLLQSLERIASNRDRSREAVAPNDQDVDSAQRPVSTDDDADARRRRDSDGGRIGNFVDRVQDRTEKVVERAERALDNTRQAIEEEVSAESAPRMLARNPSPWVEIHQQIVSKMAEESRNDLEKRSGYEFEAAFLGLVVASHIHQGATLNVLSDRATGPLKERLMDAEAVVQQHRQQAEQLMGKIKK